MEGTDQHIISISNGRASLTVNRMGGAITNFHLADSPVNPLSFELRQEENGTEGFVFRGHFLCLGRWGDPSEGEYKKGISKHGHFVRMLWEAKLNDDAISMYAESELEGLAIERRIVLSQQSSCFHVTEKVRNVQTLGRLYNMVQHPTMASPFLNERTIVDCNAGIGFDYASEEYTETNFGCWPRLRSANNSFIDLRCPREVYSSVFSFVSNPEEEFGWITAFSPDHQLLFGYIWPRIAYPWINLWIHWDDGKLRFRGLEFGTSGIHKPFREILDKALTHLLNEKTYAYIEPGELHSRSYLAFQQRVSTGFSGIGNVTLTENELTITEKDNRSTISLIHNFNLSYGL